MSDPGYTDLVNKCWVVECVTNAGVFNRNDLPIETDSHKTVFVVHLLICRLFI